MKPRVIRSVSMTAENQELPEAWACFLPSRGAGLWWLGHWGFGRTPAEAYAQWKRKNT